MTETNLKKLSRGDLLEMLVAQGEELEFLKQKLADTEDKLQQKELAINEAGSIADASLKLNGVFEAAQASCEQYIDNIKLLSERQQQVCEELEQESRAKAETLLAETTEKCETMENEMKTRCEEMLAKAKAESQAYWDEVSQRLEAFYNEHHGLRELLASVSGVKPEPEVKED